MKLSTRQNDVLEYIQAHIRTTGKAPSRTRIARHFGMYPNWAQGICVSLKRKGFIKITPNKHCGIELAAP